MCRWCSAGAGSLGLARTIYMLAIAIRLLACISLLWCQGVVGLALCGLLFAWFFSVFGVVALFGTFAVLGAFRVFVLALLALGLVRLLAVGGASAFS